MIKPLILFLTASLSLSHALADDLSVTQGQLFPATAIVGQTITAQYNVQNNTGAAFPINATPTAPGVVSAVSCGGTLAAHGTCTMTVSVAATQTGSFQFGKNFQVCINHSPTCYSHQDSSITTVTATPPAPPAPPKDINWVSQNKGLPNNLITSRMTEFNGKLYSVSALSNGLQFVSQDQGQTWQYHSVTFTSGESGDMTTSLIHSTTQLLLGTSRGLYESSDTTHWHLDSQFMQTDGQTPVAINQVLNANGVIYVSAATGFYDSYNDGQTWNKLAIPASQSSPSTNIAYDSASNITYIYSNGQLYKSSDWSHSTTGPSTSSASLYTFNGHLYSIALTGLSQFTLFESTDAGQHWQNRYTSTDAPGFFMRLFAMGHTLYMGNIFGVQQSTDDGSTWTAASFSGVPATVGVISYSQSGANNFLLTTQGMYRSDNAGETWQDVGNWAFVTRLLSTGTHFYAGTFMKGLLQDSNSTWSAMPAPNLNTACITALASFNNVMYVGTDNGTLFTSSDNGTSWASQQLPNNLYGDTPAVLSLFQATIEGKSVFYALTNVGLYTELDGQWHPLGQTGLPQYSFVTSVVSDSTALYATGGSIDGLHSPLQKYFSLFSKQQPKALHDEPTTGFVYKSIDFGVTWEPATTGLPTDENFLPTGIITVDSKLYLASNEGVYVSSDQAASWTKLADPADDLNEGIVTKFLHSNGMFYMATFKGVYQSSDAKTWVLDDMGVSPLPVTDMAVYNNTVYASTPAGVYKQQS